MMAAGAKTGSRAPDTCNAAERASEGVLGNTPLARVR